MLKVMRSSSISSCARGTCCSGIGLTRIVAFMIASVLVTRCPWRATMIFSEALNFNVAGTKCIGWSSVGQHARHAHEGELVHAMLLTQRIVQCERGREDGFFQDMHNKYVVLVCDNIHCKWLH